MQCKQNTIGLLLSEKIAEATRKFAGLQSDLSRSGAETVDVVDHNGGLKRRHIRKLPMKGSMDKAVHRSMHDIKLAFSEFYLSLILLQNYQTLNFTGFRKILKKHDKVSVGEETVDSSHDHGKPGFWELYRSGRIGEFRWKSGKISNKVTILSSGSQILHCDKSSVTAVTAERCKSQFSD